MNTPISGLIIDDDPEICSLFEIVCQTYNLTTLSVKTLKEAKNELDKFIPVFIVLDNSLPDGKGIDFINYLQFTFPCVKVIFCSADDFENELSNRKIAVHAVLKKPFFISNLKLIIEGISKPVSSNDIQSYP